MSKSWDALVARVTALEQRVEETKAPDYPPMARKQDIALASAIERSNTFWWPCRLGTISYAQPVFSFTTYSYDASYDAGAEIIPTGYVPNLQTIMLSPWADGTRAVISQYEAGFVKAYTPQTGVEIGNGTDLSGTANVPALHIGMERSDREAYRAVYSEDLLAAELRIGQGISASSSNYWTATLRRRRGSQTVGEKIGERSSASVGISAQDGVTLQGDEVVSLLEGDFLVLYLVTTGTPSALEDAVLWLKIRRRVI